MAAAVTHPSAPHDGFGEHVKLIIYTMMFAEKHQLQYRYTPLTQMAHNYDNRPDFVAEKEAFLGWLGHFAAQEDGLVNTTNPTTTPRVNLFDLLHFITTHIAELAPQSRALPLLRRWFWENKQTEFSSPSNRRIVLHIRQANAHDRHAASFAIPWATYAEIISHLQRLYPPENHQIEIVSQGAPPWKTPLAGILYFADETPEQSFLRMATADILVVGPSAFSYSAALLARPEKTLIYYIPHCNPPLPEWLVIQNLTTPRMHFEYFIPLTVWFDAAKNSFRPGYEAGFPFRVITDLCRAATGKLPPGAPERLPFNGNPEFAEICGDYIRAFRVDAIVETGTYMGRTTEFFGQFQKPVYSVESNPEYLREAYRNLSGGGGDVTRNIKLYGGDSAVMIPEILAALTETAATTPPKVLFYLDAHWEEACPLLAELKAIAACDATRDNCLIIIDDFRIPHRPDIPFDVFQGRALDINYIRENLTAALPNLHYEYYAPPRLLAQTRGRLIAYPSHWESSALISQT